MLGAFVTSGGEFIPSSGLFVSLPQVTISSNIPFNSDRFWRILEGHAKSHSPYYQFWRDEQSAKQWDEIAGILQNSGDLTMIIGTVLVFTGVGAPLGAAMITYGGYVSLAGTGAELYNDAQNDNLTYEKTFTKVALEIIPSKFVGGKAFNYLGEPLANELLNVGTIAADQLFGILEEANTGPYKK